MNTIKKTLPSSKHLVSLAGHNFILPEKFEYHLKDRGQLYKFKFKKHEGYVPPKGHLNFKVGDRVYPVRLNPDFIQGGNFKLTKKKGSTPETEVYEVSGMIELEYFRSRFHKIIINSPGYDSGLHGYDDNFLRIGESLKKEKCGSFILYQHTGFWVLLNDLLLALESIASDLQDVIDYCLQNSFKICLSRDPKLYLSGFSMGGGATAIVGGRNHRVKKMLLIAPSPEKREDLVVQWLKKYRGEVYFVHGRMDGLIPLKYSKMFAQAAGKAKKVELVTLKKCNHRFTGKISQKEFILAYSRVFAADK